MNQSTGEELYVYRRIEQCYTHTYIHTYIHTYMCMAVHTYLKINQSMFLYISFYLPVQVQLTGRGGPGNIFSSIQIQQSSSAT